MTTIDPVTLAVIQNGLQQVCNEMDTTFVRAAFSPVIAEGLERPADLAALYDLGVDAAQGYLLGRPAPPEQISSGLFD